MQRSSMLRHVCPRVFSVLALGYLQRGCEVIRISQVRPLGCKATYSRRLRFRVQWY